MVAAPLALAGLSATAGQQAAADKAANAKQAVAIIKKSCVQCHSGSLYFNANKFETLLKKGYLKPGDLAGSVAMQRILATTTDEQMPPTGPLSAADKTTLKQWVADGLPDPNAAATVVTEPAKPAPVKPPAGVEVRRSISESELLTAIVRDLEAADERERPFLRYYSLANLYRNPKISDADLTLYRTALDKLINSLSWSPDIVRTKAVGPDGLILRLDLRQADWNADIWQRIVAANPYGLLPREASAQATTIRSLSGAAFAYIRVDWFVATASVPPLYHEILDLPDNVADLEKKLGVDVAGNIEQEKAVRAGRRQSGISRNNRVVERHRSLYGAYWKSYDFAGNQERQNIFIDPISFREDGGEFIFNLPNGLQAYMIANAKGQRLDVAPTNIVRDLSTPGGDPNVTNGLSCIGCHSGGMNTFKDQLRPHIETLQKAAFDIDKALALYQKQETLDLVFKADNDRFQRAVRATGGAIPKDPSEEPVIVLARYYLDDSGGMSIEQAAADCALTVAEFQRRVGKSSRLEELGFGQLLTKGGGFKRDSWEDYFGDLVREIRLGDYVAPTRRIIRGNSGKVNAPVKLTSIHIGTISCADQKLMNRVRQNLIFWLSRSNLVKIVRLSTDADAVVNGKILNKNGEITITLTEQKRHISEDITGLSSDLDFVTQQLADRMHFQLTGDRLPQQTAVTSGVAANTTTPSANAPRDPIQRFTQSIPGKGLSISVDRGPGATYKFGEGVVIRVKSDNAGFLTLYNLDSEGNATLLFPNGFMQNNRIAAGQLLTIGDVNDPFEIKAQGVPGRETVIAIVTPTNTLLPGVSEFQGDPKGKSLGVVQRGAGSFTQKLQTTVAPLVTSGEVAQATVQFFTVK